MRGLYNTQKAFRSMASEAPRGDLPRNALVCRKTRGGDEDEMAIA